MTSNGLSGTPFEWPEDDWIGPSPAAARAAAKQEGRAGEPGESPDKDPAPPAVEHADTAGNGGRPDDGRDQDGGHLRRKFMCTDYGNGERLVHRHGRDLRYCHPWKKWLVWDGRRWRLDDTGEPERRAKRTVRSIYNEARDEPDTDASKWLGKWAADSESAGSIRAMLSVARSEPGIPVTPDALDTDPWALTVANGTLDLRTGTLTKHRRADLFTKLAPVAYDPAATAPTWERFLDRIMDGDAELIAFLQRAAGYSLTGDISEHCFFMPWGGGNNGKSVFLTTLATLLGDYGQQAASELIVKKPKGNIPNDLAALRGDRYVTIIETAEGEQFNEPLLKQLTGGDLVTARFLHAEFFQFIPSCKLWIGTNHKPDIKGTDYGIWRRVRLIPFTVTIPKAERDKHLGDKLRAELPGILAWAVRGCQEWQHGGLEVPAAVIDATEGYRREQDSLAQFIAECCVVGDGCWTYAADLYQAYSDYGGEHLAKRTFGLKLKEKGFDQAKVGHSNRSAWLGIGLPTST